jgi:uncharacterized protein with von Willebrand factor type A (vWA) domain
VIAESLMPISFRPRRELLRNLVLFARLLRTTGMEVTPDQIIALVAALDHIDLRSREDFKNAARAILVSRQELLAVFDRAFDLFWQAWTEGRWWQSEEPTATSRPPSEEQAANKRAAEAGGSPEGSEAEDEGPPGVEMARTYSALETLRHESFARLSETELETVRLLMSSFRWDLRLRPVRRRVRAKRGPTLDMRRAWRENLRYGGESLALTWRRPKLKRRPLVVLCDTSGSMEQYSRVLLQFVYVLSRGADKVEAFAFGTRLTRLTHPLRLADVDAALDKAVSAVSDWAGGTRIGEALKAFNFQWGRRVLGQGAIVLIISDGWDRGDTDLLGTEMRRLQMSCQRLIWLNPLLGDPGYEPLAKGIQCALPYVDDFLPVHNLYSLERLAELLQRLGERRPLRRQQGAVILDRSVRYGQSPPNS